MPRARVVTGPAVPRHLARGFDTLGELLALTLGPTQGSVLVESGAGRASPPELVGDAATAARRVIQLPHRAEDVGAMLLRNLVWRIHLRVGDGGATAAVLARGILSRSRPILAAGADITAVVRGIEQGVHVAAVALREMARPVKDEEDLIAHARTITGEHRLGLLLGEIFDLLGSGAYVDVEEVITPHLDREYHEGGRWHGRIASPYLMSDASTGKGVLPTCYVALCDDTIRTAAELQPLLEAVVRTESRRVLLVAHAIEDAALGALVANHEQGNIGVLAAELRRPALQRSADLADLAALTGAQVLSSERGRPLRCLARADLGTARRAETGMDGLFVIGPGLVPSNLQDHLVALRAQVETLDEGDDGLEELRRRMARLSGRAATLRIGAYTKTERTMLRDKSEKAIRALPHALRGGLVPGGGAAYLDCSLPVRQLPTTGEEALGSEVVAQALAEPFHRIVCNSGVCSPDAVLAAVRTCGSGYGYDVLRSRVTQMESAGVLDSADVLHHALETAASGAIAVLNTHGLVLHREPEISLEP